MPPGGTGLTELTTTPGDAGQVVAIPVVAERLHVGRREVEAARARVRKVVREQEATVGRPLLRGEGVVESGAYPPRNRVPPSSRRVIPVAADAGPVDGERSEAHVERVEYAPPGLLAKGPTVSHYR